MFWFARILRPVLRLLCLVVPAALGWKIGAHYGAAVGGGVPYLVWVTGWLFPLMGAAAGLVAGAILVGRR